MHRTARIAADAAVGAAEDVFLVDLGDQEARTLFFSIVPTNAAGLTGVPVSFNWSVGVPRKKEPAKPEAIVVQEGSLEVGAGRAPAHPHARRSAQPHGPGAHRGRNREHHWKDVRCTPRPPTQVVCTGTLQAAGRSQFQIYCLGEEQPCLTVGVKE